MTFMNLDHVDQHTNDQIADADNTHSYEVFIKYLN